MWSVYDGQGGVKIDYLEDILEERRGYAFEVIKGRLEKKVAQVEIKFVSCPSFLFHLPVTPFLFSLLLYFSSSCCTCPESVGWGRGRNFKSVFRLSNEWTEARVCIVWSADNGASARQTFYSVQKMRRTAEFPGTP